MNLPTLIEQIYGVFTFTGLYSFEFVDKNRNTITEIFLMCPPKTKDVSEPTRSSTIPTLGGNYNTDAGNSTKNITISGELFFPYVGSPNNPVARYNEGLDNSLNGFNEFFRLRWMCVRYRDYTMRKDSKMTVPSVMHLAPEIATLYRKVSRLVNEKIGALYDEVKLIFHDYDMDDHYYCRIDSFTSSQSADKHIAVTYNITIEGYEPDHIQKAIETNYKKTTIESVDDLNRQLQSLGYDEKLDNIQADISYNYQFLSAANAINSVIDDINDENTNIQSGQSTPLRNIPDYVSSLISSVETALAFFKTTFLTQDQIEDFDDGDITLDDVVSIDLFIFYNVLQKAFIQATSLQGIINSTVVLDELRYYAEADDYTLREEQFEGDENRVEQTPNFKYYTVVEDDTLREIALRELGDPDKFVNILRLNDISENDFIDGTLVGQKIKIPYDVSIVSRGNDNLVYEKDFTDLDKFLYGIDLATGPNKELLVSAKKDLLGQVGIENAYQNIENRVQNRKGSLNVFHPGWGTVAIGEDNAPFLVQLDRHITDMAAQVQADPRVESIQPHLDRIEFEGEIVSIPSTIYFIGTDETREITV